MKKESIPQGANSLSKAIESYFKDWGGDKYKKATLEEMKDDLYKRIDPILEEEKGALLVVATNLKRRVKNKKTKEELLLDINETLFKFFEGSEDNG